VEQRTCNRCMNEENSEDAVYCKICGLKLEEEAADETTAGKIIVRLPDITPVGPMISHILNSIR